MQIDLPLWTFAAHLPASMAIVAAYNYATEGEYDFPMGAWSKKDAAFYVFHSIAMGTLFSTAIAAGTPKFHSTFSLIPSSFRKGIIFACHLLASTAGLHLWEALALDDSK